MFRFLLVIILFVVACSVPDDDDIQPLVDAIDRNPQAAGAVKLHKDRARVIDRLSEYADTQHIGGIGCKEHDAYRGYRLVRLTLKDLREAFAADPQATLVSIMNTWVSPGTRKHELLMSLNKGLPCTPEGSWYRLITQATEPEERGESKDSAYWLVEQTTEYLLQRPALMTALGLSMVGGVIVGGIVSGGAVVGTGIGLALCPLSAAVECPDDADLR